MSFFIRSGSGTERTSNNLRKSHGVKRKKRGSPSRSNGKLLAKAQLQFEEVESEDDEHQHKGKVKQTQEYSDDNTETVQEKRLRLAKLYLEEIERKEQNARQDSFSKDAVTNHLKEELLEKSYRLCKRVAELYTGVDKEKVLTMRCKDHHLTITCLVISSDNQFIYSGSKDSAIVKWSLTERKKVRSIQGKKAALSNRHLGTVLCLALSSDNKFLASGGTSKHVYIWNPGTLEHVHTFTGHNDAITGLTFRRNIHTLFSVSQDKCVKLWNLTEMAYVETLFGHQSGITDVDALSAERAITSGGRDNSIRIWKIVEESQLIFNGHIGSIDSVKLINENHFVSCGDDGLLCLWSTMKKKPLCSIANAHGTCSSSQEPNWICSIAPLVNTDLVASGSRDGTIKLWQCGEGFRSLTHLLDVPVVGFVNAMAFTSDGDYLLAAIGEEHRFGRWWKIKEAKNSILIIPLQKSS